MAWKNLFRKHPEPEPQSPASALDQPGKREVSPHLAQVIERRTGATVERTPEQRKRDALLRQRTAALFDIEQGESALADDNPWTQRIALLGQALTTVDQDLAAAAAVPPGPYSPLPASPISVQGVVETDDAVTVTFAIGGEVFTYAEEPDWADRSRLITRSELRRRTGDPAALVPGDIAPDLREALRGHLDESLFVFASDLRDRMLDGQDLPRGATLADLAAPCPVCGGWTDWRGTCQACAHRLSGIAALKREQSRLLDERTREAEERHRLIEGLPLARRRMKDVEADIARLGDA